MKPTKNKYVEKDVMEIHDSQQPQKITVSENKLNDRCERHLQ